MTFFKEIQQFFMSDFCTQNFLSVDGFVVCLVLDFHWCIFLLNFSNLLYFLSISLFSSSFIFCCLFSCLCLISSCRFPFSSRHSASSAAWISESNSLTRSFSSLSFSWSMALFAKNAAPTSAPQNKNEICLLKHSTGSQNASNNFAKISVIWHIQRL